jgi:hypothetical protein
VNVAEFLGFTGHVGEPGGIRRYVRPAHVALDSAGDFAGSVARRVPEEDHVLCVITLPEGEVQVRSEYPGPEVGSSVRLRIEGGVRFDREGVAVAVRA